MPVHHKVNYFEFHSHDLAQTKAFFSSVFDWSFTDYGDSYVAISNAGLDGGFFLSNQHSDAKTGALLMVFYSQNLTDSRQRILDAGGTITLDIFNFPGGQRFHFNDPSQNEFAVWSDAE